MQQHLLQQQQQAALLQQRKNARRRTDDGTKAGVATHISVSAERAFFDQVKDYLTSTSRDSWAEFVKLLDLFASDSLTKRELYSFVGELFGPNQVRVVEIYTVVFIELLCCVCMCSRVLDMFSIPTNLTHQLSHQLPRLYTPPTLTRLSSPLPTFPIYPHLPRSIPIYPYLPPSTSIYPYLLPSSYPHTPYIHIYISTYLHTPIHALIPHICIPSHPLSTYPHIYTPPRTSTTTSPASWPLDATTRPRAATYGTPSPSQRLTFLNAENAPLHTAHYPRTTLVRSVARGQARSLGC